MRVLHVYSGNLYGGIERLLATLAHERHLAPGMEPAFALCFRGPLFAELASTGVPVADLGPVRFSRPWSLWRARWRLRQLLRRERFDVVMTHAAWPHAAFASTVRQAGTRLTHWVHDAMTGRGNRFEEWAGRTPPDLAVANSRFTAGTIPSVFPHVRTEVVYLPVRAVAPADGHRTRAAIRQELRTPEDDSVILQACRLERWKGHAVLLAALGRLRDVPRWTAWIAGGPQKAGEAEYLTELRTQAAAAGIAERVRFLGQRGDVADLLAAADLLCQPNTAPEPFGIAFVEALYAGRPIVTADLGGGREVVDPTCGLLTPSNDAPAVADALASLIADPARRAALGAAGPGRADALCQPARQLGRIVELLTQAAA